MSAVAPRSSNRLTLKNATIVDTRDGSLSFGREITMIGGRITSVSSRAIEALSDTDSIDIKGLFVVPGFLDMHVHALDAPDCVGALTLLLANGVTGYRQMSGSPELLERRRLGQLPSVDVPGLLAMPGAILTPANAATPDAAIATVREQQRTGADFIKVLEVPPPAFFAALREARRLGLPFVGHLPATVDVADATIAGMRAIEHLGPRDSVFAGCGCGGAAVSRMPATAPARPSPPPTGVDPARFFQRMIANPILFTSPAEFDRYRLVLDEFDEAKCRSLAALFVENQTWHVPTLIRLKTMEFADAAEFRDDARLRYVAADSRQLWEQLATEFQSRVSTAMRDVIEQLFSAQLRLVRSFQDAGVQMLAGSDFGGQWVLPGFSLHQEFDLLAQAGLAPLQILQMTTLNAARFLGLEETMGTVAEGKVADLVILEENPMKSVATFHRIAAVVRDGVFHSRERLDDMMQGVSDRLARVD